MSMPCKAAQQISHALYQCIVLWMNQYFCYQIFASKLNQAFTYGNKNSSSFITIESPQTPPENCLCYMH